MSKEYTAVEVRKMFMENVREIVGYWQKESRASREEAISGVAHSLLVMIDGGSMLLPSFELVCRPHSEDKQYKIDNGDDWFPEGATINSATSLHDYLYRKED